MGENMSRFAQRPWVWFRSAKGRPYRRLLFRERYFAVSRKQVRVTKYPERWVTK